MNKQADTKGFLNRETIKLIAVAMMTLNHYAVLFLQEGTVVHELFTGLGYVTVMIMCYFLVEGFSYTRSRKKYALRLAIFGLISQIPFCLVFTGGKALFRFHFNMIWTLLLCFILLLVLEQVPDRGMRLGLCIAIIYVSVSFDWAVLAPVFTFLFYKAGKDKKAVQTAFYQAVALFVINEVLNIAGSLAPQKMAEVVLLHSTGPVLAIWLILYCYNGKQAAGSRIWKWFFYIYYPAHLLILALCKMYGGF